jgi:hypothetical protein
MVQEKRTCLNKFIIEDNKILLNLRKTNNKFISIKKKQILDYYKKSYIKKKKLVVKKKDSKLLLKNFINFFLKKGKKFKVEIFLNKFLINLKKKEIRQYKSYFILWKLIQKLFISLQLINSLVSKFRNYLYIRRNNKNKQIKNAIKLLMFNKKDYNNLKKNYYNLENNYYIYLNEKKKIYRKIEENKFNIKKVQKRGNNSDG